MAFVWVLYTGLELGQRRRWLGAEGAARETQRDFYR